MSQLICAIHQEEIKDKELLPRKYFLIHCDITEIEILQRSAILLEYTV